MRRFWFVLFTVLIVAAGVSAPRAPSVSASGHSHVSTHLDHPDELAVDVQGNIFVTEGFQGASSRVLKLSPTGKLLASFGANGSGRRQFNSPLGVALDKRGNLYVA